MADVVTLDVGGVIYRTTRATLTRYPDSRLGVMFSGRHQVTTDNQGRCFIDRDGLLFRYVLNFLRGSDLALPEDFKEFDMLGKEAAFYQIESLVDVIGEARQERTPERSRIGPSEDATEKAMQERKPKPSSLADAIQQAKQERRPEGRKIETLEMDFKLIYHGRGLEDGWRLRGDKCTIDKILERIPDGFIDIKAKYVFPKIGMEITEVYFASWYRLEQFDGDSIFASSKLCGMCEDPITPDSELVPALHNIIFDLGFTLKHNRSGKFGWGLFERPFCP